MAFLTKKTFEYRRGLMRRMMEANGLDALAFLTSDFFQWATNFHVDVQPWERPVVAVVPLEGEPFAIMNELSTNHLRGTLERGTMWISEVTIYAEHPRVGNRVPVRTQWSETAADLLIAKGLSRGRIGVDAGGGPFGRVTALLPDLKLVPATAAMREMRFVKCEEELAVHRDAGALSDWGQERYLENIRPGRRLQELDFTIAAMMSEEASRRFPGENAEIRTWTLSGPPSASPHGDGKPTGAEIAKGHGIVNICNVRLNGLMTENERTFFVGKPTNQQVALYEAARGANEAGAAAAVAGNPVAAIDAAAQAVVEKSGFGDLILHRTGHGMGVQGHEYPDDMPFCYRPLLKDEVYSVEPGIYVYGLGGFRIDDTVVIGEAPEIITKAPRDIATNTIM
jgi:Xaa-Pro aminopeptidase